jgi:thymidylate synthase (FAD)
MYCNYSKDKFGNELTFIIPCWMDIPEGSIDLGNYDKTSARYEDGNVHIIDTKPPYVGVDFIRSLCEAEYNYLSMIRNGWKPQQARAVLPNSLKTELVMTGFVSDWEHFFKLRDAGSAHPQARELAHPLHMEFLRRNYLVDLYDEANPD